ncbi:MAG: DUF4160 domain-containing protein [Chloroflexi bacterium]|nr:MAG: DUF4160 domain-containing protein [Chloroflexota bacterium]
MFVELGGKHHEPHFHAYYQDMVASYRITEVELLRGQLPTRQNRLVEAWAELHKDELLANWQRVQNDQLPVRIAPLR